MSHIASALAQVQERIAAAARRSGRKSEEIQLMAVSKFHDVDEILQAYAAGQRLFGENRVQEAASKFQALTQKYPDINLHLIGTLQRNKAKQVPGLFSCVQSVDRDEILVELSRRAVALGMRIDILLEMHTGEESKAGYPDAEALFRAADLAVSLPGIRVRGLMTMAPYTGDEKPIRASFRTLVWARDTLVSRLPQDDWSNLSMGMTNDYEIAVEEGSTLVRVGTAIFGSRPIAVPGQQLVSDGSGETLS